MLKFKKAQNGDEEILKNIAVRAFQDDKDKYGSFPPGINFVDWHKSQIHSGMYYKILFKNMIIGGIRLFDKNNGHYRLGAIFISPDYQNKGIGHKAIEFIENLYPNAKKWSLDTPYQNYRNHYFYEKHGYVKVGEIQPNKKEDFYLFLYEKEK